MKELVLMRHGLALSVQESGADGDAGRKLSPDGKAQIAAASKRLKELGFSPGVIISSPFLRAVETAAIAASLFPGARRVEETALVSQASLPGLLKAVAARAAGEPSVLVVGHQPVLGALGGLLLKTDGLPLGTGSFIYLKLPDELKLPAGPGSGKAELTEFFSPELL